MRNHCGTGAKYEKSNGPFRSSIGAKFTEIWPFVIAKKPESQLSTEKLFAFFSSFCFTPVGLISLAASRMDLDQKLIWKIEY